MDTKEEIAALRGEIERLKQALALLKEHGKRSAEAAGLQSAAESRYAVEAVNTLTVTTAVALREIATTASADVAGLTALVERLLAGAGQPATRQVLDLFLQSLRAADRGEAPLLH